MTNKFSIGLLANLNSTELLPNSYNYCWRQTFSTKSNTSPFT